MWLWTEWLYICFPAHSSYRHITTGAVIARCGQPEVSWWGWRNADDEHLVQSIAKACAVDSSPHKHVQNSSYTNGSDLPDTEFGESSLPQPTQHPYTQTHTHLPSHSHKHIFFIPVFVIRQCSRQFCAIQCVVTCLGFTEFWLTNICHCWMSLSGIYMRFCGVF